MLNFIIFASFSHKIGNSDFSPKILILILRALLSHKKRHHLGCNYFSCSEFPIY